MTIDGYQQRPPAIATCSGHQQRSTVMTAGLIERHKVEHHKAQHRSNSQVVSG